MDPNSPIRGVLRGPMLPEDMARRESAIGSYRSSSQQAGPTMHTAASDRRYIEQMELLLQYPNLVDDRTIQLLEQARARERARAPESMLHENEEPLEAHEVVGSAFQVMQQAPRTEQRAPRLAINPILAGWRSRINAPLMDADQAYDAYVRFRETGIDVDGVFANPPYAAPASLQAEAVANDDDSDIFLPEEVVEDEIIMDLRPHSYEPDSSNEN